jgi:hypothetical protein
MLRAVPERASRLRNKGSREALLRVMARDYKRRLMFEGHIPREEPRTGVYSRRRQKERSLMSSLTQSPAWQALAHHHESARTVQMRTLFADDPERFSRFSASLGDLFLDFSKNRVTGETMKLLFASPSRRRSPSGAIGCFRGEDQRDREPRRAPRRAPQPLEPAHPGRRQGRDARGERGPRQDARRSPIRSAAARGRGTPASASRTSSTSASAGPISAR